MTFFSKERSLTIIKTRYAINIFHFRAHVTLPRFHFLQQLHLFLPSLFQQLLSAQFILIRGVTLEGFPLVDQPLLQFYGGGERSVVLDRGGGLRGEKTRVRQWGLLDVNCWQSSCNSCKKNCNIQKHCFKSTLKFRPLLKFLSISLFLFSK